MTSRPKYNQYLTSNRRQVPAGLVLQTGVINLSQRGKGSVIWRKQIVRKHIFAIYMYYQENTMICFILQPNNLGRKLFMHELQVHHIYGIYNYY